MKILAIDPGSEKSAWVIFDPKNFGAVESFGLTENVALVAWIVQRQNSRRETAGETECIVIEQIKSYGAIMGDSLLTTCVWIGRFLQAFGDDKNAFLLPRKTIVAALCHNARAKDRQVRRALLDRFPATGGGKNPSIGTQKNPGPLKNISRDVWSALAVAVAFCDLNGLE